MFQCCILWRGGVGSTWSTFGFFSNYGCDSDWREDVLIEEEDILLLYFKIFIWVSLTLLSANAPVTLEFLFGSLYMEVCKYEWCFFRIWLRVCLCFLFLSSCILRSIYRLATGISLSIPIMINLYEIYYTITHLILPLSQWCSSNQTISLQNTNLDIFYIYIIILMPPKNYELDRIVKMKEEDGKRFFRIKWVGFSSR